MSAQSTLNLSAIVVTLSRYIKFEMIKSRIRKCVQNSLLGTSSIRTDNDPILPTFYVHFDIPNRQWLRKQVVHRGVKKPLNLTRVQIHCDNMIASSNSNHVRNKLSCDRCVFQLASLDYS